MFREDAYEVLTDNQVLQSIVESNGIVYDEDWNRSVVTDAYNLVSDYRYMREFVSELRRKRGPPFKKVIKKGKALWIFNNILTKYYRILLILGLLDRDNICYCPELKALLEVHREIDGAHEDGDGLFDEFGERTREYFNVLCEKLRERILSPDFRKQKNAIKKSAKRRFKSAIENIDAHLQVRARVLPVSVDFHYGKKYIHTVTDLEAREHRDKLLTIVRKSKEFDYVVGYIVKMEEGVDRGIHFHAIFLVDGNLRRNASVIATNLAELWSSEVVSGIGYGHDCHRDNNRFKWRNVGMVHYNDLKSIERLHKAIAYLTKPDQYLVFRSSLKANVFTMSQKPRLPSARVGRPRKYKVLDQKVEADNVLPKQGGADDRA